ncbi:histidine kinase, partial [Flavobacteriaceae bacterium]|nr:histidine kinase [Flavobacteriaceae bacterium]
IAQRNEYLEKLKGSIDKQEKDNTSESKISREIKNDINRIIGSEKVFKDFENQFNKVYPDFFKDMLFRFGKLSNTDLRLSAYIKMNQSNSQIAQITGASIRTVESQRYRLSKKLDLTKEDDLNSLIISL